jgi:S-(hydroxymethyl)glutathione dehydrogenase/alcohol dehydrogenase
MRAAVFREPGVPIRIEDVEIDAPRPREVLVRTIAAGVCHSDLSIVDGTITALYGLPMVLGHESAGVVEAVGSDVTYVEPGDHVVTCLSIFCGECEYCLSGRPALCPHESQRRASGERPRLSQAGVGLTPASQLGSFAERLLVHEHAVVKIDRAMPLDLASVLGCGLTTGLGAVIYTAGVRPGQTVAVIGCGGVGLGAVQGARLSGARRIVAVDRVAARLDRAARLGATDVIDASQGDAVAAVLDRTGGVDHVFEAVGRAETCQQALKMLGRGGRVTIIGVITTLKLEISGADLMYGRSLGWSMMGSNRFRLDIPYYVELYLQGRLQLDDIVTARVPLQDVNEALAALSRAEGARTVLLFDR